MDHFKERRRRLSNWIAEFRKSTAFVWEIVDKKPNAPGIAELKQALQRSDRLLEYLDMYVHSPLFASLATQIDEEEGILIDLEALFESFSSAIQREAES